MQVNQKPGTSEKVELLDDYSKDILLNEFLAKHYSSENVVTVYLNKITNMLYELDLPIVSELTINNYREFIPNSRNKTTQESYCDSFFRFLYAYDYLKDNKGFESIWTKDSSIKHFERLKRKVGRKTNVSQSQEDAHNSLSFEELTRIQEILNKKTENIEMIKIGFVWYMLFETDVHVQALKKLKSNQYKNGYITIKNDYIYKIPHKYQILFEHLNERTYSGFFSINEWIKKLGELAEVGYLYPQRIVNTRKQNVVHCGNCKKKYTNTLDNWMSVNNRIICISCYENLKKKSQ